MYTAPTHAMLPDIKLKAFNLLTKAFHFIEL